nr:MAG TPA: hypothetical protein [Caudoviricetes sp.]
MIIARHSPPALMVGYFYWKYSLCKTALYGRFFTPV